MNNLYGWAMSGYLPYGRFKWLKNVDNFDVSSISEKCSIGYILEADLEYPDQYVIHCTTIIQQLQRNLQFLMTYCQIVKKLLTNMK